MTADRTNAVRDLTCSVASTGVDVHVSVSEGVDATLELYTAEQRKELLESSLGQPVTIHAH